MCLLETLEWRLLQCPAKDIREVISELRELMALLLLSLLVVMV